MRSVIIFFLQIFLLACQRSHNGDQTQQTNPASVDFEVVRSRIFSVYCFGCHSAAAGNRAGINLETYASVRPLIARIKNAVNSGRMSATGGPLTTEEINLLNTWIDGGFPEEVPGLHWQQEWNH